MAQLASVADLNASQGTNFQDTDPVAIRVLELASAAVIGYTGQDFEVVTGDVVGVVMEDEGIWLPQRPVKQLTDFAVWYWGGYQPLDPTAYAMDPSGWLVPLWPGSWYWIPGTQFQATYDHGYDTIPDEIVAVTCTTAGRQIQNPTQARREGIGTYSISYDAKNPAPLTDDDKVVLDRYKHRRMSIQTHTPDFSRIDRALTRW
jgi:hypothetical protein